jgi:hypothetical protein
MTLGNNPQPLTRRQARELARDQAPVATADEPKPTVQEPSPVVSESAAKQPRRAGTPETTPAGDAPQLTNFSDVIDGPAEPEVIPVSVFAPRAVGGVSTFPSLTGGKRPAPERTLTRRQLRAVKAAEKDDLEAQASGLEPASDEFVAAGPLNPPVGHWSVDRDEDGHTQTIGQGQPFDQFMSRGVGAGGIPTTTNALILPSIPQQGGTSGPLTGTGEILITGSFDLPRSLGSTGAHPNHFDSSDMDHMLDQLDEGGLNSNVAPVSASRAVSTHTSTRGVMTPPQKRGASLPTVLAVTAAVLGVGVVALIVLGLVFRIF